MNKLILIAVLFFTANVAGAEYKYPLEYVDGIVSNEPNDIMSCVIRNNKIFCIKEHPAFGGWCANGFIRDKDSCDCVKEQPEAITADNVSELCQDKCHLYNVTVVQSEAEKWRGLCEEYLSKIKPERTSFLNSSIESRREDAMRIENAQIATVYCTRYNGALLDEIRKESIR